MSVIKGKDAAMKHKDMELSNVRDIMEYRCKEILSLKVAFKGITLFLIIMVDASI